MTTVVATDLDGTVIFSDRSLGANRPAPAALTTVDADGDRPYAYMTGAALRGWSALAMAGAVIPATTRSVPQYRRLRLPGPAPAMAVVCNGARLLVAGESDPAWERTVRRRIAERSAGFAEVWRQATTWHVDRDLAAVRAVEEFFLYFSVRHRADWTDEFVAEVHAWVAPRGWRASLQGRKLYLLPVGLDKTHAVAEAARRLSATRIVAGGDSLLDEAMLRAADAAIRPAHGELHETGFTVAHCRTTLASGADAGDEILEWYATQLAA